MDRIPSEPNLHVGDVRAQVEALLIAPLLEPLAAGTGATGEYEADLFAREIARRLENAR